MTKALFCLLLLVPMGAFALEKIDSKKGHALCEKGGLLGSNFSQEHKLKNGTALYVCGWHVEGSGLRTAQLWIAPKDQDPKEFEPRLTDISGSFFGVRPITVRFNKKGLVVTENIPLIDGEKIQVGEPSSTPGFERVIKCQTTCVEEKTTKCVFKKLPVKKNENLEAIFKIMQHPKHIPIESDQLIIYRVALTGDKKAISMLLDKKYLKKMDDHFEGEIGEGDLAHVQMAKMLTRLKTAKCL